MDIKNTTVKENVGPGTVNVQIISKKTLSDLIIRQLKGMTLDEARKYGKVMGFTVRLIEE